MRLFQPDLTPILSQVADLRERMGKIEGILSGIQDRVDGLETAPTPAIDLDPIRALVESEAGAIEARLRDHESAFDALDGWKKEILLAVSDGIERTDRAERRISATVRRAKKSLEEAGHYDSGVEAEYLDLRIVDGEGSQPLPAVQQDMELGESHPSSVAGVSAEILARARGYA